jgi:hypothetical protein
MIDKTALNSYDLYEPFHNIWVIDCKSGKFYGNLREVLSYMINKLNFDLHEIEDALLQMTQREHNAAHFGTFKAFLFTFNKEITNAA